MRRHRDAFGDAPIYRDALDVGGEYQFRVRGEDHVWTAATVAALQHAVRGNLPDQYRAYAKVSNEQSERLLTIRGLFRLKPAEEDARSPVPIEEVEPASKSCGASPPAPCRSARSRARRIPRSPSP